MHAVTTKTNLLLTALILAAWTAAGCDGGSGRDEAKSPATPAPNASPVTALPSGVVGATAVPTAVPNSTESRKNVKISDCKAAKDGWQATGTARNPGTEETGYTITVFFTTGGGTVIGSGKTKVEVDPGADREWKVSSKFKPAPDTRCVLRGVG